MSDNFCKIISLFLPMPVGLEVAKQAKNKFKSWVRFHNLSDNRVEGSSCYLPYPQLYTILAVASQELRSRPFCPVLLSPHSFVGQDLPVFGSFDISHRFIYERILKVRGKETG